MERARFGIELVGYEEAARTVTQLEQRQVQLSETAKGLRREIGRLSKEGQQGSVEFERLTRQLAENKVEQTQLRTVLNRSNKEMRDQVTAVTAASGSYEALRAKARLLQTQLGKVNVTTEEGRQRYARLKKEVAEVEGQIARMTVTTGRTQKAFGGLAGLTPALQASLARLGITTEGLQASLNRAGVSASGLASTLGVGLGVAGAAQALRFFGELDDQQAAVAKTTGLTREEIEKLRGELLRLDTRTGLNALLEIAEAGGRIGIATDELGAFTEQVDKLVVALGDDLGGTAEDIATTVGRIVNVFGVEGTVAEGLRQTGSAINELAANTQAGAQGIVGFTRQVQGAASAAGVAVQDILGLGATLDGLGAQVEPAGTAIGQLFQKFASDTEKFAALARVDVAEFTDLVNTDINQALLLFLDGVNAIKSERGFAGLGAELSKLGLDGQKAAQTIGLLSGNVDQLRANQELANQAFEEGVSLQNEFDRVNETFNATISKLSKTLLVALLPALDAVARGIQFYADVFTGIGRAIDGFVGEKVGGLVKSLGLIAIAVGAVGVAFQVGFLGPIGLVSIAATAAIALIGRFADEIKLGVNKAAVFLEGFGRGVAGLFTELGRKLLDFGKLLDPRYLAKAINGDVEAPWRNFGKDLGDAFSEGFESARIAAQPRIEKLEAEVAEKRKERAKKDEEEIVEIQVRSIASLREKLKGLREAYEQAEIGSEEYLRLAREIRDVEKEIKAAEGVADAAKATEEAVRLASEAWKQFLELQAEVGALQLQARIELAKLAYEEDLKNFKGNEELKAEFAKLRYRQLLQEIEAIRQEFATPEPIQPSSAQGTPVGLPGEPVARRRSGELSPEEQQAKQLEELAAQLSDAALATNDLTVATQGLYQVIGDEANREIAQLREQIKLRQDAGISAVGLERQLAAAQERAARAAQRQEQLASAQAAAQQAAALALAFKGLGTDISKGFPQNIIAVASTLALVVSTFAAFRRLRNSFRSFAQGGELSVTEGGAVPTEGGVIQGRAHASGGVKGTFAGQPVEVEGGEGYLRNGNERYVINRRSMANPRLRSIASWVNEQGGGRAFAAAPAGFPRHFQDGGSLSTPTLSAGVIRAAEDQLSQAETLAAFERRMDRIEVVVSSEKITDVQSRASNLERAVTVR